MWRFERRYAEVAAGGDRQFEKPGILLARHQKHQRLYGLGDHDIPAGDHAGKDVETAAISPHDYYRFSVNQSRVKSDRSSGRLDPFAQVVLHPVVARRRAAQE